MPTEEKSLQAKILSKIKTYRGLSEAIRKLQSAQSTCADEEARKKISRLLVVLNFVVPPREVLQLIFSFLPEGCSSCSRFCSLSWLHADFFTNWYRDLRRCKLLLAKNRLSDRQVQELLHAVQISRETIVDCRDKRHAPLFKRIASRAKTLFLTCPLSPPITFEAPPQSRLRKLHLGNCAVNANLFLQDSIRKLDSFEMANVAISGDLSTLHLEWRHFGCTDIPPQKCLPLCNGIAAGRLRSFHLCYTQRTCEPVDSLLVSISKLSPALSVLLLRGCLIQKDEALLCLVVGADPSLFKEFTVVDCTVADWNSVVLGLMRFSLRHLQIHPIDMTSIVDLPLPLAELRTLRLENLYFEKIHSEIGPPLLRDLNVLLSGGNFACVAQLLRRCTRTLRRIAFAPLKSEPRFPFTKELLSLLDSAEALEEVEISPDLLGVCSIQKFYEHQQSRKRRALVRNP